MQTATPTVEQLTTELVRASPKLNPTEQRVAVTLFRLLAEGRPVPAQRLADQASLALSEVRSLLGEWPGAFLDDDGAVIGFWGMALSGTARCLVPGSRSSCFRDSPGIWTARGSRPFTAVNSRAVQVPAVESRRL